MDVGRAPEPSRRGFVADYPPFRRWRPESIQPFFSRRPLNVYVHLPYCHQRCAYCFFRTIRLTPGRRSEIGDYVAALCREIEIASKRHGLRERPVSTLYFGGGTPTLLAAEHWCTLFRTLEKHLTLRNPEITVEAEPISLAPRKAELLQGLGVNRISIGIQSFSDEVIRATGRKETEARAFRVLGIARRTGAVVNLDLLCGLAGQTPATWSYTLARTLATAVETVTIYKMELYPNSGYFTEVREGRLTLPSDAEELALFRFAVHRLGDAGYRPVSTVTFARDESHACRHLANRFSGEDMVGFGLSAFGALGDVLYQNTSDMEKYLAALNESELPLQRGHVLDSVQRVIRGVLLELKLVRLARDRFRRRHGLDPARFCEETLADLVRQGLVAVNAEAIALTTEGVILGDYVGKCLAADLERRFGIEATTRAADPWTSLPYATPSSRDPQSPRAATEG